MAVLRARFLTPPVERLGRCQRHGKPRQDRQLDVEPNRSILRTPRGSMAHSCFNLPNSRSRMTTATHARAG